MEIAGGMLLQRILTNQVWQPIKTLAINSLILNK